MYKMFKKYYSKYCDSFFSEDETACKFRYSLDYIKIRKMAKSIPLVPVMKNDAEIKI